MNESHWFPPSIDCVCIHLRLFTDISSQSIYPIRHRIYIKQHSRKMSVSKVMLERWAAVLLEKACWTMTGTEEIVLEPGTLWVEIFVKHHISFGRLIPQTSHIAFVKTKIWFPYLNYLTFYKSVGWWFSATNLDSKNVINYVLLKTLWSLPCWNFNGQQVNKHM